MSSRTIVIVIALVIVGFTLVSLRDYFTQAPAVEAVVPVAPRILVAKHNLASGAFIQAQQDLDWQAAPAEEIKTDGDASAPLMNYQYENSVKIEDFAGAVVRRSVRAGEAITSAMLMKSGEGGFMSAVLEPGKRAVSISVNPISGNAGFVSPGDRVDLLITYHMKNGAADSVGTETFIRNVRVLAVDQSLENPENKAILAKTITVEVSPNDAEKISVAAEMGKISVALVSTGIPSSLTKDTNGTAGEVPSNVQNYTLDGDVSSLISHRESSTSTVKVIRGDKVETLEFYQDKQ